MTEVGAYWMFAGFAGILGLLFGSFLNVCIARIPEDRSVVYPGSACPKCGEAIKPYDNVPVLAWLWLGGRCRACRSPISGLYPMIEALFGVLSVLLFRRVIPDLADLDLPHLLALGWYGWLLFGLVALTMIDLRHLIIPDEFSLYTVPVGVVGVVILGALGYEGAPSWQGSLIGAAVGAGSLGLLTFGYWLLRREVAMGMGDIKLLAAFGAYFGPLALFPVLMIASTFGAVVGVTMAVFKGTGLRAGLPFGPFLAVGAGVWLYAGPWLEPAIILKWGPLLYLFTD